jgi:hypothetical protein
VTIWFSKNQSRGVLHPKTHFQIFFIQKHTKNLIDLNKPTFTFKQPKNSPEIKNSTLSLKTSYSGQIYSFRQFVGERISK